MIEVKVGLEIEYIPTYADYYRELKEKWELDILLLGQHFSLLADGSYTFDLENKSDEAHYLAEGIVAGMESGLFDVVAHPDQIFRRKNNGILNRLNFQGKLRNVLYTQALS